MNEPAFRKALRREFDSIHIMIPPIKEIIMSYCSNDWGRETLLRNVNLRSQTSRGNKKQWEVAPEYVALHDKDDPFIFAVGVFMCNQSMSTFIVLVSHTHVRYYRHENNAKFNAKCEQYHHGYGDNDKIPIPRNNREEGTYVWWAFNDVSLQLAPVANLRKIEKRNS